MKIILASKSPRRQQMLTDLGLNYEIRTKEVEEVYPADLKVEDIAVYLAELKAKAFREELKNNELVITADTVVCVDDTVLGKPKDKADAVKMLQLLSGRSHRVISGVCLMNNKHQKSFTSTTKVFFKALTTEEINYYIDNYQPFDKAGAYGIQEWIGYIGIERIEGSYYNVVGLPIQRLYEEIKNFNK